MFTYVIPGSEPASVCRRRMMQRLVARECMRVQIADQGDTDCGPATQAYLDRLSSPCNGYYMFRLADVADGLLVTELQAQILAQRVGLDRFLFSVADALRMQQELARAPAPEERR